MRDRDRGETRPESVAEVAHELNNILQAILGHAHLALEQDADTTPRHLDTIQECARRATSLTEQLLRYEDRVK